MSPSASGSTIDRALVSFFGELVRVSLTRPERALFFGRTVLNQIRAACRRGLNARRGVPVPPIAIVSVTDRCNLSCKGCYAQALRAGSTDELDARQLRDVVAQAVRLGTSFFVLAGGEPLLRPEVLDTTREFSRAVFLLVTNGLLLDERLIERLAAQPNTVPVLSVEGAADETDERRGAGVYALVQRRMEALRQAGVLFALSVTVHRRNFEEVTAPPFVERAMAAGARLFIFLEFTPVRAGSEGWSLAAEQRDAVRSTLAAFRQRYRAVFIGVPWDEAEHGGCLAAGRGFVHVSARGDLEPCPFAPFSDVNLRNVPLERALRSPFLAAVREQRAMLGETQGGCALWNNRELLTSLSTGAQAERGSATGDHHLRSS